MKPFPTIAIALGSSPSLAANIREAGRLTQYLGDRLYFIHVEEASPASSEEVRKAIEQAELKGIKHELIIEQGNISDAVLKVVEENSIDLLLAGALPREGLLRYYMGSVARQLVRRSNCSILLLSKPELFPKRYQHVVVTGNKHPKTADTIQKALQFCEGLGSAQLSIVEEIAPEKKTKRAADDQELERCSRWRAIIEQREEHRLQRQIKALQAQNLTIETKVIFGKPGYSIGHFAESNQAELLVLNSPDTKLGFLDRVFTHDLEYILSELPCDLLIVHSHRSS